MKRKVTKNWGADDDPIIKSGDYIRDAQLRELDMDSMLVQALIDVESQDLERQQLKLNSLVTASALLVGFAFTCLVEVDLEGNSLRCMGSESTINSTTTTSGNVILLAYLS